MGHKHIGEPRGVGLSHLIQSYTLSNRTFLIFSVSATYNLSFYIKILHHKVLMLQKKLVKYSNKGQTHKLIKKKKKISFVSQILLSQNHSDQHLFLAFKLSLMEVQVNLYFILSWAKSTVTSFLPF